MWLMRFKYDYTRVGGTFKGPLTVLGLNRRHSSSVNPHS